MCAIFDMNDVRLRPGLSVGFWRGTRVVERLVWAGFAQREKLDWWRREKGGFLVDVPASRFAERSTATGILAWDDVPAGLVIRGLVDPNAGKPLLKVVTRASTPEELRRYEHPRMPLLEAPLFSAAAMDYPDLDPRALRPRQTELF